MGGEFETLCFGGADSVAIVGIEKNRLRVELYLSQPFSTTFLSLKV